jgi:glycosyltransferase 2 family protein
VIWLGLAVSAFFLYLAVRNVRPSEVWDALTRSDYWWTIPAIALLFVAQVVRALRWQYLFAAATRPPYRPVFEATLLGQCFNNVLPARAGEVARILALHRAAGTSRAETTSTVLVERLADVLVLLAMLFVFVPWLPHVTWLHAAAILAVVLVVATVASVLVLLRWGERPFLALLRPIARLGLPFLTLDRAEHAAASFVRGAVSLRDPRLAALALFLTAASWIPIGLSTWMLMIGFHLGLSPLAGLLVTIATGLSLVLPSSPGAVGVFEAAALVGLKAYGIDKADALSFAIVLHAVNFFPYVLAGLLVVHIEATRSRRRAGSPR